MARKNNKKLNSLLTSEQIDEILTKLSIASEELFDPLVTNISRKKKDPYRILIATILSLRTKDEITYKTTELLFSKAETPDKMISLSNEELEQIIFPVGFYKRKAETILSVSQRIINDYGGRVPNSLDELLRFKGVGRKTANLVITMGFGKPGICVDVHVGRITQRIGIVPIKGKKEKKPLFYDPDSVEMILREILPQKWWIPLNNILVKWGQNICTPVSPKCNECVIYDKCARVGVEKHR